MSEQSPRQEFFYFNDDGELVAARLGRWKANFAVQRAHAVDPQHGARDLPGERLADVGGRRDGLT